jgi:hypothetical protein
MVFYFFTSYSAKHMQNKQNKAKQSKTKQNKAK